ncbi:hypothetical protein DSO57_1035574 [Entomophthora muscae]|uniref:Uncharacterized protein n=1 Tax=Entomophthora muscae TaxID=34485 RepID=A0ACC2SNN9_9FUNG|nr:hypothetical protein DSO57_1035574 [Entomophthora muscae]
MQLHYVLLACLFGFMSGRSHHCKRKYNEPRLQALQVGANPSGVRYTLPKDSFWAKDEPFPDHFFKPTINGGSIDDHDLTYTFVVVEKHNLSFTPCSAPGCSAAVWTCAFTDNVIKLSEIPSLTADTILTFKRNSYGKCQGSTVTVPVPLQSYASFTQRDIILYVDYKHPSSNTILHAPLRFRVVRDSGKCDTFITAKRPPIISASS